MDILDTTPNTAAIAELGQRLARLRKQQGFTQAQLAEQAGLGVATLRRIEDGRDAQLGSWIKLFKALGMIAAINDLVPQHFNSPMAEVKAARKSSQRGHHIRDGGGVVWGDELSEKPEGTQ